MFIMLVKLNFQKVYKLKVLTERLEKLIQILSQYYGLDNIYLSGVGSFKLKSLLRINSLPIQETLDPNTAKIIGIHKMLSNLRMVKLK